MQAYIQSIMPEYIELIKTLTAIPAPSHQEQQKAAYVQAWMQELASRTGMPLHIFTDEATNVVCELFPDADPAAPVSLFLAHTDTVFPDTTPIPVTETEEVLAAPGIGDDTANVAALMMGIRYLAEGGYTPTENLAFVFNSCEEGLGNLKGCRAIMDRYAGRVKEFISFDGSYRSITNVAVGSERYDVCIKTEGGHSYGSFGNKNAIAAMAELICDLYRMDARKYPGHTTYNVGTISGGTSVNAIAQEAHMFYEFRSDSEAALQAIKQDAMAIFDAYANKYDLSLTLLGARPSMGEVDPIAMNTFLGEISDLIVQETGRAPSTGSGSTDCNIPLSLGIPALCFGAYLGKGAHTREEHIFKNSLPLGLQVLIRTLLRKFRRA